MKLSLTHQKSGLALAAGLSLAVSGCEAPEVSRADQNVFCWAEAHQTVMAEDKWMRPPGVVCTPVIPTGKAKAAAVDWCLSTRGTPAGSTGHLLYSSTSDGGGGFSASAGGGKTSASGVTGSGSFSASGGDGNTSASGVTGSDSFSASGGGGNTSTSTGGGSSGPPAGGGKSQGSSAADRWCAKVLGT